MRTCRRRSFSRDGRGQNFCSYTNENQGNCAVKRILTLAAILVAAALSSLSWVSQARAQTLTYVSSTGIDSADCASPATACRSFAGALNKVADGGSVICAGVGEFSPPTITKSVTIDCSAGGGGTQSVRFIINAPGKIVRLR